MVKGISKQVIVVHAPEPRLFDQAIFILKDNVLGNEGVTDEALMKEAKRLLHAQAGKQPGQCGPLWACGGAVITGLLWLISALI